MSTKSIYKKNTAKKIKVNQDQKTEKIRIKEEKKKE